MSASRNFRTRLAIIYLVCVGFAALLWLLIMLDKTYTSEIVLPIEYTNLPTNKTSAIPLPEKLNIDVQGRGYSIFKYLSSASKKSILINLNGGPSKFTIGVAELRESVAAQLNPSLTIISVNPAQINVALTTIAHKTVPVIPNAELTLRKGFVLKQAIYATPSTINISGATEILDSITYVTNAPLKIEDLGQNTTKKVAINIPEGVYSESHKTTLNINIEHATGAERNAKIKIEKLPANKRLTLFPDVVSVKYEVGMSRYEESLQDKFIFSVNYNDTQDGKTLLEITPVSVPDYIQNLSFSPHRVEYIIE